MQKVGSVLCIIMGIILGALCGFALIKGTTSALIVVGLIAGILVIILGVLFIVRANNKKLDAEDVIED